jgi:hypothetical protein
LNSVLSLLAFLPHAWWARLSQSMQKPAQEKNQ